MAITAAELNTVIDTIYDEELKNYQDERAPEEWSKFITSREGVRKRHVQERQRESMGIVQAMDEGQDAPELTPKTGYTKRTTMRSRGACIVYTDEAELFDEQKRLRDAVSEIVRCFDPEEEIIGAAQFDLGHTAQASVQTYGGGPLVDVLSADGLTWFNTAHTWKTSGRTWGNYRAYVSISESTIDAVSTEIMGWTDSIGAYLTTDIKQLVVPKAIYNAALRCVMTDFQQGTANNDRSITQEYLKKSDVVCWKWLQNPAAYYFRTTHAANVIRRYARRKTSRPMYTNGRNGTMVKTWVSTYSQSVADPHGWYRVGA